MIEAALEAVAPSMRREPIRNLPVEPVPVNADLRARLPTQVEYREKHGVDRPSEINPRGTVLRPYFIGHGQQLAREREAAKAAAMREMYGHMPPVPYTRGQASYKRHKVTGVMYRVSLKPRERRLAAATMPDGAVI